MSVEIEFRVSPSVTNQELSELLAKAWPGPHGERDYRAVLDQSLGYICAYRNADLVGFVNVAWDGGVHAFLLDPTVRSDFRRRGIGQELVQRAVDVARGAGCEWLHVDYEPGLAGFYKKCGFRRTEAGLINLRREDHGTSQST